MTTETTPDTILSDGMALPVSLDVLEAGVLAYLMDRFGEQAKDFWKQPPRGRALHIYALQDDSGWTRLGALGELWLRGLGPQKSHLRATPPDLPTRQEILYHLYGGSGGFGSQAGWEARAESLLRQAVTQQLEAADPSFDSWFYHRQIELAALQAIAQAQEEMQQNRLAYLRKILSELLQRLQQDGLLGTEQASSEEKKPLPNRSAPLGNPGLAHNELVMRLARTWWAEDIRTRDPFMTWKEISREIRWPHSLKLLEDARKRLARALKASDPMLREVRQYKDKLQGKNG